MIKSITITNHLNESITLELYNPASSGFMIKSIDGLGPVKASVNMTELATNDGAIDNSARLEPRTIVLSLGFWEDVKQDTNESIEDLRLKTYKYFPIKRNITFLIETDNRICQTVGRVESNEPDIFSKEEGCVITIDCPDPYFYSAGEDGDNEILFYGAEPLFEFEFDNNSLDENLIEFGEITLRTEGIITYEGDAETGVIITIHSVGNVTGLTIYNMRTRETMKIDDAKLAKLMGGKGIQAGDTIEINTNRGKKGITMLRSGKVYNILNALDKPVSWFQLVKGDNIFNYTAEDGLMNLQFGIKNKMLYEGV